MAADYMLDTDTCIDIIRKTSQAAISRLEDEIRKESVCISCVTLSELTCGVFKSSNPDRNRLALLLLLAGIEVKPYDEAASWEYGKIRAHLESLGTPIGSEGLFIAAPRSLASRRVATQPVAAPGRGPGTLDAARRSLRLACPPAPKSRFVTLTREECIVWATEHHHSAGRSQSNCAEVSDSPAASEDEKVSVSEN